MREVKDDHFIVFIALTLDICWHNTQIIEEEERSDIMMQFSLQSPWVEVRTRRLYGASTAIQGGKSWSICSLYSTVKELEN